MTTAASKSNASSNENRVMIHASSSEGEAGHQPQWRGQHDREITSCPYSEQDGVAAMSEINSRLERILDKAPSDSSANLLLRKTKDGYKAFFRVRSAQQRFAGFISGRRLIDVVERVMKDVRGQIDDWKETRRLADDRL